jgi:hypothetical protein
MSKKKKKIAVIGAGIFGISAAIHLGKNHDIDLYEKNKDILQAASGINQYRAHRGYHYPRSRKTVLSCLKGEKSFRQEYPEAMIDDVDHFYCIAKKHSFINSKKFLDFCKKFDLEFEKIKIDTVDKKTVELCIKGKEALIDPIELKKMCFEKLKENNINLLLNTKATKQIFDQYDHVVICTYAMTNELLDDFPEFQQDYQYELCEKIVVKLPKSFENKSIVIMDGPFMCLDPYGRSGNFLLGNVTHAIHTTNIGKYPIIEPQYENLLNNGVIKNPPMTRFKEFIDSGKHFFPELKKAKYIGSMFTIRTVLPFKDKTDERPTLVKKVSDKIFTVYSGKFISSVEAAKDLQKLID